MRFELKVPNDDDGECLGVYVAEALPRVGDTFFLYHPKLAKEKDWRSHPFEGKVDAVTWDAVFEPEASPAGVVGKAEVTVWLAEHLAPPTIYCECTDLERAKLLEGNEDDPDMQDFEGQCFNCSKQRKVR